MCVRDERLIDGAGRYLHDDDEGQLGGQDVPELHGVGVLLRVAGRVAVVTVPDNKQTNK